MAVSLPQYGGEGGKDYKGKKSDMSLPQYGGEGSTKTGKQTDMKLLDCYSKDYSAPGRELKVTSGT